MIICTCVINIHILIILDTLFLTLDITTMFLTSKVRLFLETGSCALASVLVLSYIHVDICNINKKKMVSDYENTIKILKTDNEKLVAQIKLYQENLNVVEYKSIGNDLKLYKIM